VFVLFHKKGKKLKSEVLPLRNTLRLAIYT